MKANALILTESDLPQGADFKDPKFDDFELDIPGGVKGLSISTLDFVAYANDGSLKVFKFRQGKVGTYKLIPDAEVENA